MASVWKPDWIDARSTLAKFDAVDQFPFSCAFVEATRKAFWAFGNTFLRIRTRESVPVSKVGLLRPNFLYGFVELPLVFLSAIVIYTLCRDICTGKTNSLIYFLSSEHVNVNQ